jgi:hypothetical protein
MEPRLFFKKPRDGIKQRLPQPGAKELIYLSIQLIINQINKKI